MNSRKGNWDVGYQLIGPTKGARHPIPAGGLFSTGSDLAKLYQFMLAGSTSGGKDGKQFSPRPPSSK